VRNYDLEFLKRFSIVIGFLAIVTIGLIVFAYFLHHTIPSEVSPQAVKRTEQRIAPIGAVYAGSTGASAQAAAAAAAAAAAMASGAYGGTLDGKVIYDNLCTACHTSGVGMAPTLDHSHWDARLTQGKDTLYKHAIEGYTGPDGGVMPPKGGNAGLSEEQIHAAVDWMLDNLK
jgi:cytochrome c5